MGTPRPPQLLTFPEVRKRLELDGVTEGNAAVLVRLLVQEGHLVAEDDGERPRFRPRAFTACEDVEQELRKLITRALGPRG